MGSRYLEWVTGSRHVGEAGAFVKDTINGLGLIDEELIKRESEVMKQYDGLVGPIETLTDLELRTLCQLWVLGAYEVVRILANWAIRDKTISFAKFQEQLAELKVRFERLRIPLAKHEVARRFKDTDLPFAFPILLGGKGIAWRVSDTVIISRRELSDALLTVLGEISRGT
jgi:hypothetical protein